jgi:hypothetical protein
MNRAAGIAWRSQLASWWTAVALLLMCMGLAFELAGGLTGWVLPIRHQGESPQVLQQYAAAHQEIYQVVFAGGSFAQHTPWQQAERDHFADVARLVWWGRAVLALSCAWLGWVLWRRPAWQHGVMRQVAQLLVAGALLTALVGCQWTLANRLLHPILFPHGNWSFSADRYMITRLYDGAVLASVAVIWAVAAIALTVGALALVHFGQRLGRKLSEAAGPRTNAKADAATMAAGATMAGIALTGERRRMRAWRSWQPVILLAMAGTPVLRLAGWWPVLPGDAGHWMYYLLILFLGCGCWGMCCRRAWGVPVLCLALCWYGGLVSGVRAAMQQAATEAQAAQPVVDAIAQFRRERGRLPTLADLEEVAPLPALSTGTGEWYLNPYGNQRDFVFGFIGPLGYHYNWRSVRNNGAGGWRLARYHGVP